MKQEYLCFYPHVYARLSLVADLFINKEFPVMNLHPSLLKFDGCHHELVDRWLNFCFSDDNYVPIVITTILHYLELYSPSCVCTFTSNTTSLTCIPVAV